MNKHKLYTVAEVARILKLSTITVYKYIKEQKLEAIEFGRYYRISALSLEKFIQDHTLPTHTEGVPNE
ncbi:MAG: helix-turn-helix domain-containing protein [Candidatus Levybacteria bacterium]|nr:helix-turn-helix domain-containing protein [Candidatus Levybacteria bacterium]